MPRLRRRLVSAAATAAATAPASATARALFRALLKTVRPFDAGPPAAASALLTAQPLLPGAAGRALQAFATGDATGRSAVRAAFRNKVREGAD